MADQDRPLIPSSPYFHGGTALLAAAPVMGISMPKAMQARADVAQKIIDRATNDGMRLQRGIGELEEAASPGLQDLAARLSRRAEAGTRLKERAVHQLATEGKILKGMGIGAGVLGAGLTAKGLYDHFHEDPSPHKTAGMAQAFHDLGFRETSGRLFEKIALGMTLRFNSPEEVQEHNTRRNVVGALGGGLLGGAAGGALGGRLLGLPGAVMGGVAGAALGSVPGKLLADTAHDYRERTTSTYNDTMQRLNAAAGGNIRVASALDEFIQFADQDAQQRESADADPAHASGFQTDQEKRERPPGFGPPSALAGADAGTRMLQIGLPASGAT